LQLFYCVFVLILAHKLDKQKAVMIKDELILSN